MSGFIPFRFQVTLFPTGEEGSTAVCQGRFSEVTGLEMNMSPKTIREGGRNWGEVHLAGPTTFAPIVLKRGVTEVNDLYDWLDVTTRQANYGYRLDGEIAVFDADGLENPVMTWKLSNVLATKFKGPDLSSTASAVAIEELHLVHEGMVLERRKPGGNVNREQGGANE